MRHNYPLLELLRRHVVRRSNECSEPRGSGLHRLRDALSGVELDRGDLSASPLDFADRVGETAKVSIRNNQPCSFCTEQLGSGPTNTLCSARDDPDFSIESTDSSSLSRTR